MVHNGIVGYYDIQRIRLFWGPGALYKQGTRDPYRMSTKINQSKHFKAYEQFSSDYLSDHKQGNHLVLAV